MTKKKIKEVAKKTFSKKLSPEWIEVLNPILGDFFICIYNLKKTYSKKDNLGYQCTDKSTIYPLFKDLVKPFQLIQPKDIKGFIIGVEPYNNGEATGIPFQLKPFEYKPKFVLGDMNQELNCIDDSLRITGDLPFFQIVDWEYLFKQGIMCFNTAWTSEEKGFCSFFNYWKDFSLSLMNVLCKNNLPVLTIGERNKGLYRKVTNNLIEAPDAYSNIKGSRTAFISSRSIQKFNGLLIENNLIENNLQYYK